MLGLAFLQLYNGCETPFQNIGVENPRALQKKLEGAIAIAGDSSAPLVYPEQMPHQMADLIKKMCSIDFSLRPTAREVCAVLGKHVPKDIDLGHTFIDEFNADEKARELRAFDATEDSYSALTIVGQVQQCELECAFALQALCN